MLKKIITIKSEALLSFLTIPCNNETGQKFIIDKGSVFSVFVSR